MSRMSDKFFADLARISAAANPRQEGDYKGDDGFLYCGKCRTPKQSLWKPFDVVISHMCKCEHEKAKKEAELRRSEKLK